MKPIESLKARLSNDKLLVQNEKGFLSTVVTQVYCKADFKPSSMQAICLYLRKGQTVFSIYLFDLFSDLRIDAETEHIRLGRCHNVFHFGFLLT